MDVVQLRLELVPNQYKSYSAELLSLDNNRSLRVEKNIKPNVVRGQNIIYFTVPADLLLSGDYRVQINGIAESGGDDPLEKYHFRVVTP
jgi:hypothetical protein